MGTKSLLFGAHCVPVHAAFVVWSYVALWGWPPRWRDRVALVVAALIHDMGYVGKERMDDRRGEDHVLFGAWAMQRLFGPSWRDQCLYHSRFWTKLHGHPRISRFGLADKLAVASEPWWLYLPRVMLSGEIDEYMELARRRTERGEPKYAGMNLVTDDGARRWFADVQQYLRRYVAEHHDGRDDTWTPSAKRDA